MNDSNNKSVVLTKTRHLLELKYSGRTPANYLHHISKFLDHAKNVPLRVNNEDILKYNLSIRDKGHSYRNAAINAIKAYFKLFLRKEVKGFSSIRPPKRITQPKVYDAEMLAAKINAIANKKHKAILALGLSGWLRRGEVVNLKITDIDSARMKITINQSKGSSDREVILTESTLKILRDYVKEFKPVDYLFNGQSNIRYSGSSCNKISQNHLGVRFHSLRASGATHAVKMKADLKAVSEMLGHKKIETTKFYIPPIFENLEQVI